MIGAVLAAAGECPTEVAVDVDERLVQEAAVAGTRGCQLHLVQHLPDRLERDAKVAGLRACATREVHVEAEVGDAGGPHGDRKSVV